MLIETVLVHLLELEGRVAFCMYTTTLLILRVFFAAHRFENYPTKIDPLLKKHLKTTLSVDMVNLFLETIVIFSSYMILSMVWVYDPSVQAEA